MQHLDNKRALVVFSGGQDSTTCLFWAKAHFEEVWALSFTYGQKHVHEVDLARKIAKDANVHFDCMDASFISQLATSCSLTDTSIVMDSEKPAAGPPNTFVPGRNLFFLSIAAVYAHERGIRHLVTGVSQTDFSGYPRLPRQFHPQPQRDAQRSHGHAICHPHAANVDRQMPNMGIGRPPRRVATDTRKNAHLLQRHTR